MSTANGLRHATGQRHALTALAAAALLSGSAYGATVTTSVTLCAERFDQTMLGQTVPMWGYRQVASAGLCASSIGSGTTAPGPVITVPPVAPGDDSTLVVTLVNNLTVPTSLVLAAQALPSDGGGHVMAEDVVGPTCTPPTSGINPACRVRSFTGETAPGATRTYTFTKLRPGTYLYQSGTHPQVQVQMGLFGMARQDASASPRTLAAGSPQPFDLDVPVVLSEVDPDLHNRIASTLGSADPASWKANKNSTLGYKPKYFLINGKAFDAANPAANELALTANAGSRVALRLANAGLTSRVLMLNKGTWQLVTEDGYAYPAPREQSSVLLAAGKTSDAVVTTSVTQSPGTTDASLVLFDRRTGADNGDGAMLGGQVARLAVTVAGQAVNQPPIVNAGAAKTVYALSLPATVSLNGSVIDDSLALPLTIGWSKSSGPGNVTFTPSTAATTSASISAAGNYVMRLNANDTQYSVNSDVNVTVLRPVVNAGADIVVNSPTAVSTNNRATASLTGTQSGFTTPALGWSKVGNNPTGTVNFTPANALATTASFPATGTYTLRLTGTEVGYSTTDDVNVTVVANRHIQVMSTTVTGPALNLWAATVRVRAVNALGTPIGNAQLTNFTWTTTSGSGSSGNGGTQCTTSTATATLGECTLTRLFVSTSRPSVTLNAPTASNNNPNSNFQLGNNATNPGNYDPAANEGLPVTVARP